jgi:hypothetical protein
MRHTAAGTSLESAPSSLACARIKKSAFSFLDNLSTTFIHSRTIAAAAFKNQEPSILCWWWGTSLPITRLNYVESERQLEQRGLSEAAPARGSRFLLQTNQGSH